MSALPYEVLDRVATKIAFAYRRRGVRSVSREDMYQDACEVMLACADKYDESKGDLEGYLYRACANAIGARIAREICPVTSRNNGNIPTLRTLKKVSMENAPVNTVEVSDVHRCVWRRRVRKRIITVAGGRTTVLKLALGLCKASDLGVSKTETQKLYAGVRALKRNLLDDLQLYTLSRD